MGKRLLVLSYWGVDDVLTTATILPWLQLMQADDTIEAVHLFTIERESRLQQGSTLTGLPKIKHQPLYPVKSNLPLLTKILDFTYLPAKLTRIARSLDATGVFAHGSPAGALAYKVSKKLKLPFYVSSFEPHADYMLETGVWRRFGLKYIFQKCWEQLQKYHAAGLIPVTESYKKILLNEGVAAGRIAVVPCVVDVSMFKFSRNFRKQLRSQLSIPETVIVGIYAGKYGGLYYDDEAFRIYKSCFRLIPDFRLIILTPQHQEEIIYKLQAHNIDLTRVNVLSVPHKEVPAYLSAADFGFATIRSYPSARFCSPVKIGEYWANGLPVLLTEGVSDDSDIIKNEGGGALFNLQQNGSLERAIDQILAIVSNPAHRQEIPKLATKYRSSDRIRETYEYFFARHNSSEL